MTDVALVREVGIRDGLQMSETILSTERKIEWAHRSAAAGIPEVEITSFVPPHILPQFADAEEVVSGCHDLRELTSALVVNLKGARRAFDADLHKVNYVVSASEAHSMANARRSTDAALDEFEKIVAERQQRGLAGRVKLSCGIATAFGCTIQGPVPEARVYEMVERVLSAGVDEVMLADTVGYGNPLQVKRIMTRVAAAAGSIPVSAHFHDTRALGLANVIGALEAGIRRFDASLGGLGGCPFAPGATGNISTEDTVFLLETMGVSTGIDIDALLALRTDVEKWLPKDRFSGAIARAGLPKTFSTAA